MILIAILSANNEPFQSCTNHLIKGYGSCPGVEVLSYVGGADAPYLEGHTLHLPCPDSDTIRKQELMLEWVRANRPGTYWIVKQNASTVVNLRLLTDAIYTGALSQECIYCAFPMYMNIDNIRYNFPMGNFTVLHYDLIDPILRNYRQNCPRVTTDDVYLGKVLEAACIRIESLSAYSMESHIHTMFSSFPGYKPIEHIKDTFSAYLKISDPTTRPDGAWGMPADPLIRTQYEPQLIDLLFQLYK